jgi:hypothetical protein
MAAAACCLNLLYAQSETPAQLFARAQEKVRSELQEIPRYTCLQTTDRERLVPPKSVQPNGCYLGARTLAERDRLRLEIAIGGKREMFAWPGQSSFDMNEPAQFGLGGAMATGLFSMLLSGAMVSDAEPSSYRFLRDTVENGRQLAEFAFRVPQSRSHYTLQDAFSRALVGWSGTLSIDRKTADVYRLQAVLDVPSTFLDVCAARLALEFRRTRIQSTEPLLVESADLDVIHTTGEEARNHTVYSACHMFATESTLRFDMADPSSPAPAPVSLAGAPMPAGIRFEAKLAAPFDASRLAVGDRLDATLARDLKDAHGKVIARKGATLEIRIVMLSDFVDRNGFLLGLHPERVIGRNGAFHTLLAASAHAPKGALYTIPPEGTPPGTAMFTFPNRKDLRLPRGWVTYWQTIAP